MNTVPINEAAHEQQALRDAVSRLAHRHFKALRESPQRLPTAEDFTAAMVAAREAGILGGEAGAGLLWAAGDAPAASIAILEVLGGHHAGIAFHLHLIALGEWLAARIGLAGGDDALVPWLPDGQVLALPALVGFLASGELRPGLEALLPAPEAAMHWSCADTWDGLFVPVVLDDAVRLCLVPRSAIVAQAPAAHGLDGVALCRAPLPEIAIAQAPPAIGPEVFAELLGRNALGLMAIALGVVRTARDRARAQASLRRQGGKRIEEHPAVQDLLARQQSAILVVESLLAAQFASPQNIDDLCRVFSQRIVAHDLLCTAANAAMQVFGGSGYMRDLGLERAVRDCNQLRVLAGSPSDLRLFIARAGLEVNA